MSKQDGSEIYNIVAFVFADPGTAEEVSKALKHSAKDAGYKVIANAAVVVDEKGKTHIHEAGHGTWGSVLGFVGTGALAAIGGPAGVLAWAVAGGVVGGFAGKYGGRAIPKKDLEELGAEMQPNTSAILAMVEDKDAEALVDSMAGYKAKVVTLTVGDELSGEISQAMAGEVTVTPPEAEPAAAKPAEATKAPDPHGDFAAGERTSTVDETGGETGGDFAAGERTSTVDETGGETGGDFAAGERTSTVDETGTDFAAGEDAK